MQAPVLSNALGDAMKEGITNYSALQSSKQYNPLVDKMRSESTLNNALSAKAAADTTSALSYSRMLDAQAGSLAATTDNTKQDTLLKQQGYAGRMLGTGLVNAGTQALSSARDGILDSVTDIISNITQSSAKKVPPPPSPDQIPHITVRRPSEPRHDGSLEHLLD